MLGLRVWSSNYYKKLEYCPGDGVGHTWGSWERGGDDRCGWCHSLPPSATSHVLRTTNWRCWDRTAVLWMPCPGWDRRATRSVPLSSEKRAHSSPSVVLLRIPAWETTTTSMVRKCLPPTPNLHWLNSHQDKFLVHLCALPYSRSSAWQIK